MKLSKLTLLVIPFMLASCGSTITDSTPNQSSTGSDTTSADGDTNSNPNTNSSTPGTDSSTPSTDPSTDPTTTGSTNIPPEPVTTLSTIEEVNAECLKLTLPTAQPHVSEEKSIRFTIRGYVMQNLTSGTTKTGYTPDGKTMLVDSTGWILCSSASASSTSLYQKVKDYVDEPTSEYIVTGHIANSFGVPELVVEEFEWQNASTIAFDISKYATEFNSLADYYQDTYSVEYNIKGNGVGKIVKLNNLTCIGRADNSSTGKWTFIDENNKYIDVLYAENTNAFVEGKVYDLIGLQNVYHYNASLRCLRHVSSNTDKLTEVDPSKAETTTIKALFDNVSFTSDSYNKVSETYFNNKAKIYKASAYINHFEKSGKWYVTLSDSDYTPTAENDAYSHYQVPINNDGYWNTTESSFSYHNLYSYEDCGEPIDVYFSLYQENHVSVDPIKTKAIWKVYLYETLVPSYTPAE